MIFGVLGRARSDGVRKQPGSVNYANARRQTVAAVPDASNEPSPLEKMTEKELAQLSKQAERDFDRTYAIPTEEVFSQGRIEEHRQALDAPLATIRAVSAEQTRRSDRARSRAESNEFAWARREREQSFKKPPPHPATFSPMNYLNKTKPPVLAGVILDASRLTREEGEELSEIATRLYDLREGGEPEPADVERWEQLVGKWAGDEQLYSNYRRTKEVEKKMAKIRKQAQVDGLPKRSVYEEQGSVTLPREVFEWLEEDPNGDWSAADIGFLAVMLFAFANRSASIFAQARFEEEDREPVLVCGGIEGLRFTGHRNGSPVALDSGQIRVGQALPTVVRNGWFEAEGNAVELRIRLGPRTKKIRAGKEAVEATA